MHTDWLMKTDIHMCRSTNIETILTLFFFKIFVVFGLLPANRGVKISALEAIKHD